MSNIYCGSKDKVPKGKKRGNMKECVKTKQVRLYGVNKIDPRTLKAAERLKNKVKGQKLEKAKLIGELNKLDRALKREGHLPEERKELKQKHKETLNKILELQKQLGM